MTSPPDRPATPSETGLHAHSGEADEGRFRRGAFFTLFCALAGHALLETAGDALFLSHIAAERLPWAYLLIAFVALVATRVIGSGGDGAAHRRALISILVVAAVGTTSFFLLIRLGDAWVYYALYVWAGVASSLIVVAFWLLLGDIFTIIQGKRLYASISTGGALGAIAGFGLANGLTEILPPEFLLLASGALYSASVLGPIRWLRAPPRSELPYASPAIAVEEPDMLDRLRAVSKHPYTRKIATLVVLSTVTLTLGDYLFKSTIAREVPKEDLALWLSRIYFSLNLVSLALLLLGVTRIIQRLGVHRAHAVMPALIGTAAVGALVMPPLAPILMLKAVDGSLRYSLQKTASELLYLPMPVGLRGLVKSFIDILGQRGAKAIGSVLILALVALDDSMFWICAVVVILSAAWVLSAFRLRQSYLDVFRQALSEGDIETRIDFPELDLASLETLIRALNHSDDRHVLAALDLLEVKDRVDLIPSLILYHPSTLVVARALDLLASSGRRDFIMIADRLLEHDDPTVRAATVRAIWAAQPDRHRLEALMSSDCACVRISAVLGLRVNGWLDPAAAQLAIDEALRAPDPRPRMSLANGIRLRPLPEFRDAVQRLARDPDPEVRHEAVRAIRAARDPADIPLLICLLDDREIREDVRCALLDQGAPALAALDAALASAGGSAAAEAGPPAAILHIPRTISRFGSVEAGKILLRELVAVTEPEGKAGARGSGRPRNKHSGMVRFKILRGLGSLRESEVGDQIDMSAVELAVERNLARILDLIHAAACLEEGRQADELRQTCGSHLLLDLLRDKERLAIQRLFRMLFLLQPEENFRQIWNGLQAGSREIHAHSMELLDNLLDSSMRQIVLAVVSQGSERARLRRAGSPLADWYPSYAELIALLARDRSRAIQGLALYHASEMGIDLQLDAESLPELEWATLPAPGRTRELGLAIIKRLPDLLLRIPRPSRVSGSLRA